MRKMIAGFEMPAAWSIRTPTPEPKRVRLAGPYYPPHAWKPEGFADGTCKACGHDKCSCVRRDGALPGWKFFPSVAPRTWSKAYVLSKGGIYPAVGLRTCDGLWQAWSPGMQDIGNYKTLPEACAAALGITIVHTSDKNNVLYSWVKGTVASGFYGTPEMAAYDACLWHANLK